MKEIIRTVGGVLLWAVGYLVAITCILGIVVGLFQLPKLFK